MTTERQTQTERQHDPSADRLLDFRPGMPMHWEITRSAADTEGEALETVNSVGAGAGGPPGARAPERAGELRGARGDARGFIDGQWQTLQAGEKAVVPPGTPHTLRNSSGEPVRIVNIHRPALRFEEMFRELSTLIKAGKIRRLPPKDPRSVLYAAMLFAKYPDLQ